MTKPLLGESGNSGLEVRLLTRSQDRVKKNKWDFGKKPGLEKIKKKVFGRKSVGKKNLTLKSSDRVFFENPKSISISVRNTVQNLKKGCRAEG